MGPGLELAGKLVAGKWGRRGVAKSWLGKIMRIGRETRICRICSNQKGLSRKGREGRKGGNTGGIMASRIIGKAGVGRCRRAGCTFRRAVLGGWVAGVGGDFVFLECRPGWQKKCFYSRLMRDMDQIINI